MSARKKQNVPRNRTNTFHNSVGTLCDLLWRFTSRAAVAEKLPVWIFQEDLVGPAAFIFPIIPLNQVAIDFSHISEAC